MGTRHLHRNTGKASILVSRWAGGKNASSGGLTDGWRWQLATVGAKLSITGVGIRSHAGVADRTSTLSPDQPRRGGSTSPRGVRLMRSSPRQKVSQASA